MFVLSLHILILMIEIVQFLLQFSITLFPLVKIKLVRAFTFANFFGTLKLSLLQSKNSISVLWIAFPKSI